MKLYFDFSMSTRLIILEDNLFKLVEMIPRNKKIILFYGINSALRSGLLDEIAIIFSGNNVTFESYGGIGKNFDIIDIEKICKNIPTSAPNDLFLIAVGGSSVIDVVKCISLRLSNQSVDVDYIFSNGSSDLLSPVDFGVVLTNLGTGSEINGAMVLSSRKALKKKSFSDFRVRPQFALADLKYVEKLDIALMANNVIDAISHYLEQLISNSGVYPNLIDNLIIESIIILLEAFQDYIASCSRASLASLVYLCSNSLSFIHYFNRAPEWLLHNLEYSISGLFQTDHPRTISSLILHWLIVKSQEIIYKPIFQKLNLSVNNSLNINNVNFLEYLESFISNNNLPLFLSEIVDNNSYEIILEKFKSEEDFINSKSIDLTQVNEILRLAFENNLDRINKNSD